MKGLMLVNKGLEKVARDNILELTDIKASDIQLHDSLLLFEISSFEQLCTLSYMSQIANRILLFIDKYQFVDNDDLLVALDKSYKKEHIEHLKILRPGSSFRVSAKNVDKDAILDITDIEKHLGSLIYESLKDEDDSKQNNDGEENNGSRDRLNIKDRLNLKVNLKSPECVFYLYLVDNHAYLGLDFSGDISKRDYRIFNSPMSLKGTTAFGLLMISGYEKKDIIVNTFCNSGTIEIEAALYANRLSPRFYNKDFPFKKLLVFKDDAGLERFFASIDNKSEDKRLSITAADTLLRNITAAKKNAKIAGCEKFIEFRRIDTDWLDLKFEEKSIDKMMTFIPGSSKHKNDRSLQKLFKEFFYQAEYILKDSGMLSILCLRKDLLLDISKEHFRLLREEEFYSGEQQMAVLIFKKIKITGEKF